MAALLLTIGPEMIRIRNFTVLILICFCLFSCTRKVYIVRHAEKITSGDSLAKMMRNDPPLSEAGKVRALVLKNELNKKHIRHIYATNTIRTMATVQPLSQAIKVGIQTYDGIDSLVHLIQSTKGNVLAVGHSNTVDDIVNKLCGQIKIDSDLKDSDYDNLFIIRFRGKKISFERRKYGYPSNP